MKPDLSLSASDLLPTIQRAVALASGKSHRLDARWRSVNGAPVCTVDGRYTARGWTQWTQGFQYGIALLCFDLTDNRALLESARQHVLRDMAEHLTHTGVHDHGFTNISTYGQLRRLMLSGRIERDEWELNFYELALKVSGAVQAARWTALPGGLGFIHSFNGPHSLFIDTIRSLRVVGLSHALGHALCGEQDVRINLLSRLAAHALTSAQFSIYYGEGRDIYDMPDQRGRTVHEAIFNTVNGAFRCPSSQQGYSPFTTWTRGLAWAMLGYAEQLEFLRSLPETDFGNDGVPPRGGLLTVVERAARATCDFYIAHASALDGICYWDTGAPNLHRLGDWPSRPADPFNAFEPVDSSASAIAAQGLIRLGHALGAEGRSYTQADLTVLARLLEEPYLSTDSAHEGLLLHSVYHRPNGWDAIPAGQKVPCNESSMWGDYHLLEAMHLVARMAEDSYVTFF